MLTGKNGWKGVKEMEMLGALLPLLLMFAIFYFLLIRPQQKRQKKVKEMHESLQKGDKVITIGGLHGKIDAIDDDRIVVDAGSDNKLTFDRSAVREVVNPD
ncbi:protein translocase subunit yajC [Salisediminibacterium halotolerans]|uniref:Preprotein translocase subunit YajC n=2 Tax=Salisediminibacterium halotolerans TaxID=517425 RepID=A0A1H9VC27_9BACI|nr:protein translocase subunit yajC [Actinophytocola xinjiangensis]RPE88270.1 protein translocase subunit yajC [Salisediminibacterium halotolerans]TWG37364.1 protein translocase subunit yajC [Salisediminibacterium halotolerans]SES19101.1 preprotein translocase subunit YajC [Salisediminibacterium haloalkalitolerans]